MAFPMGSGAKYDFHRTNLLVQITLVQISNSSFQNVAWTNNCDFQYVKSRHTEQRKIYSQHFIGG